jgi:hypothetical protein
MVAIQPGKGTTEQREAIADAIKFANGRFNSDAYNCHSYAWDNSQGDPSDPKTDLLLPKWDNDPLNNTKDYHKLQFNEPNQVGDRVIYFNDDGKGNIVPTHSTIVSQVDKDGFASQVTSKWGEFGVYTHAPRDVPASYGENSPVAKTKTGVYYRHN